MFKKISDLQKGDKVLLNYGSQNGDLATCRNFDTFIKLQFNGASFKPWDAVVMAKPRGKNPTVVFLEVHGWENDLGDTYAHQIIGWWNDESGTWEPIEHTEKQKQMEKMVDEMMG